MNPTSDPPPHPAAAQPTPFQQPPTMRPPVAGEQLAGWNPPPPPGWTPQGPYLRMPPPVAPNGQPLASFGDRFLAFLLDYVIYYAVTMLVMVPLYIWWFVSVFDSIQDIDNQPYDPYDPYGGALGPGEFFGELFLPMIAMMAGGMLALVLFTYLYFVEFQLRRGQTIGKKTMKLKVVHLDPAAGPITRSDLVKRWSVEWVAAAFVPGLIYLDGLWQLWDKPFQQCLHDKAAKTVVVKVG